MTEPDPVALTFSLRMWRSMLATQELLTVYLGLKLGLYDALADGVELSPPQLAKRAGIDQRYAREWLEQQAVAGILTVAEPSTTADQRTYSLPPAHATVLRESEDPLSMAALAVLPLGGVAVALPRLLRAYRTGEGVPDEVFGEDWLDGHSGANRALFSHSLAGWIARYLPDLHARLAEPGRRAADVGCGAGWSSLALARAYPELRVHGIDVDGDAVARAGGNAHRAGLADRVSFAVGDGAAVGTGAVYDLVCLFDTLHEVCDPVGVLRGCRASCRPGGTVLVMDAKVGMEFGAPGDEVEQFQYATSTLHCLPVSRAGAGPGGSGTVLRPDTVRQLATSAGYAMVTLLPVPDRFHRLYRLMG